MPDPEIFHRRLEILRAARGGISVQRLSFSTEIPLGTIHRWVAGGTPSLPHLRTFCARMDVSSDWLIGLVGGDEPMPLRWDGRTERRRTPTRSLEAAARSAASAAEEGPAGAP